MTSSNFVDQTCKPAAAAPLFEAPSHPAEQTKGDFGRPASCLSLGRTPSYSPVRFGNIPHVALRRRVIHLFRKVLGILGAFQPMAWTVSESLHRSVFHKKYDSAPQSPPEYA
jgi:hypothetical protein